MIIHHYCINNIFQEFDHIDQWFLELNLRLLCENLRFLSYLFALPKADGDYILNTKIYAVSAGFRLYSPDVKPPLSANNLHTEKETWGKLAFLNMDLDAPLGSTFS